MSNIQSENVPHCNVFPSGKASRFSQSSLDLYDLSYDDEEYIMPETLAEMTPGQSDCAVYLLKATRLNLNSLSEPPKNWGQDNLNLHDYHYDPEEISSIFWIPDITDWCCQQEKPHLQDTDLSTVACGIFSIIPHGVAVEVSFSLGRDIINWRQSQTTGETLPDKFIVMRFAWAYNGIFAANRAVQDTTETENDSQLKK